MDAFYQFFWIFLIFTALTPYFQKQMLAQARTRQLRELERKRRSRGITLIHRQESVNLLGIPVTRYISIDDSEAVLTAIRLTDDDVPIDLVLHTPGGLVLASEQIAEALLRHPAPVTVFVPHYAMSGGTMIALAADHIVMDQNAVLGPVDPQIGQYPAASVLRVLREKERKDIDDETLIMADMAEKAIGQVKTTVKGLLRNKGWAPERVERVATLLTQGTWTHDYPIGVDEAAEIGLEVETDVPGQIFELISLYPQGRNNKPNVFYAPGPYRREDDRNGRNGRN